MRWEAQSKGLGFQRGLPVRALPASGWRALPASGSNLDPLKTISDESSSTA